MRKSCALCAKRSELVQSCVSLTCNMFNVELFRLQRNNSERRVITVWFGGFFPVERLSLFFFFLFFMIFKRISF